MKVHCPFLLMLTGECGKPFSILLPKSITYFDLRETSLEHVAKTIFQKVRS
jgi:hypothetical protein